MGRLRHEITQHTDMKMKTLPNSSVWIFLRVTLVLCAISLGTRGVRAADLNNRATLGDNVNSNDVSFQNNFPFLASSQQPRDTGVIDDRTRN
jgi:hypothetical protein